MAADTTPRASTDRNVAECPFTTAYVRRSVATGPGWMRYMLRIREEPVHTSHLGSSPDYCDSQGFEEAGAEENKIHYAPCHANCMGHKCRRSRRKASEEDRAIVVSMVPACRRHSQYRAGADHARAGWENDRATKKLKTPAFFFCHTHTPAGAYVWYNTSINPKRMCHPSTRS